MATHSFLAPSLTSGRGSSTLRQVLGKAWTTACVMVQTRQTRRMLTEMDGRMLADIGIGRGDAQMEAARPFWDVSSR